MIHLKQFPWWLAQARKIAVSHLTLGLVWSEAYMTLLTKALYPDE